MKHLLITVDGTPYDVTVETLAAGAAPVAPKAAAPAAPKVAPAAPKAAPAAPAAASAGAGSVKIEAPMPGNILDVKVTPNQAVKAGDCLVILEAMKMENEIVAPQDGTIAGVSVNKGDVVNAGDVLITMN